MATIDILENAGFQNTALSLNGRVAEAAKLFAEGVAKRTPAAEHRLKEAMTRSDFPLLLGKAFEVEAIQRQKDAVKEYEPFTFETTVPDFRPKKFRDIFGSTVFEEVAEGEEYKADSLSETEIEIQVKKFGRRFQYTWELAISGDFTGLADFPRRLGNGAVETSNRNVFSTFVGEKGPRADFFDTVANVPLSPQNLDAAIRSLALKEDHRGDLVDTTKLVLVVPPTLAVEANRIVGAAELDLEVTDGNKKTITKVQNPFAGMVEVLVTREVVKLDSSAKRATTWYLLPGKETATPSVIHASLQGHESVDIRVKNDQGNRVGGGAVPFEEGSYMDDTIDFRGRHVDGAAKGFTVAAYASTGA